MTLKVYTPSEIGLQADYDSMRGEDAPDPEGWFLHWPGVDVRYSGDLHESMRALRQFEQYHLGKGWRGIAYDYAVDLAGNVFVLRGTGRSGATSGDFDEDGVPNNVESDAILCIIGNAQRTSPAMRRTVQALIDSLGGIRSYVTGHKYANGTVTQCPGPHVLNEIVGPLSAGERLEDPRPEPTWPGTTTPSDWRQEVIARMDTVDLSGVSRSSSTFVRGDDVKRLQGLLVAAGVAPDNTIGPDGSLDGIGGPGTRRSLEAFQRGAGLSPDAIAGEKTWGALLGV